MDLRVPTDDTMPIPQHHRENGQAPSPAYQVVILSDPAEARRVQEHIEQLLQASPCQPHDLFSIKLALEEALVNAIKHGNQLDRTKKVQVTYHVHADRFEVQIVDEGPGFDPEEVPDPTLPENIEKGCGRGVFLIRGFMTEVTYHAPGNVVTMAKVREAESI